MIPPENKSSSQILKGSLYVLKFCGGVGRVWGVQVLKAFKQMSNMVSLGFLDELRQHLYDG